MERACRLRSKSIPLVLDTVMTRMWPLRISARALGTAIVCTGDGGNTGVSIGGCTAFVDGAGGPEATRMSDEVEERLDAEIERCAEADTATLRSEP